MWTKPLHIDCWKLAKLIGISHILLSSVKIIDLIDQLHHFYLPFKLSIIGAVLTFVRYACVPPQEAISVSIEKTLLESWQKIRLKWWLDHMPHANHLSKFKYWFELCAWKFSSISDDGVNVSINVLTKIN